FRCLRHQPPPSNRPCARVSRTHGDVGAAADFYRRRPASTATGRQWTLAGARGIPWSGGRLDSGRRPRNNTGAAARTQPATGSLAGRHPPALRTGDRQRLATAALIGRSLAGLLQPAPAI